MLTWTEGRLVLNAGAAQRVAAAGSVLTGTLLARTGQAVVVVGASLVLGTLRQESRISDGANQECADLAALPDLCLSLVSEDQTLYLTYHALLFTYSKQATCQDGCFYRQIRLWELTAWRL